MAEDLDAFSWDRITQIGQRLSEEVTDEERHDLGRELKAIAQANASLYMRLGVLSAQGSGTMLSSGIEVADNRKEAALPPASSETTSSLDTADDASEFFAEHEAEEHVFIARGEDHSAMPEKLEREEASYIDALIEFALETDSDFDLEPASWPLQSEETEAVEESCQQESAGEGDDLLQEGISDDSDEAGEEGRTHEAEAVPIEDDRETKAVKQAKRKERKKAKEAKRAEKAEKAKRSKARKESGLPPAQEAVQALPQEPAPIPSVEPMQAGMQELMQAYLKESAQELMHDSGQTVPNDAEQPAPQELVQERIKDSLQELPQDSRPGFECDLPHESAQAACEADAEEDREKAGHRKMTKRDFATFRQLYEGRASGLRLYEDADGHIVAVDSSKLL